MTEDQKTENSRKVEDEIETELEGKRNITSNRGNKNNNESLRTGCKSYKDKEKEIRTNDHGPDVKNDMTAQSGKFQAETINKGFNRNKTTVVVDSYANEIAEHYNKIPSKSYAERRKSYIINIRNMNNFIKSVLFNRYVKRNGRVLDLGCGKGGDLLKYKKMGISYYYGLDIADKSISECKYRYSRHKCPFKADFNVCDTYHTILNLGKRFDVISIQFSFHYSFESEESFTITKQNINEHLHENGYLLLTVPDRNVILRRYHRSRTEKDAEKSISGDQHTTSDVCFGNEYYTIKFKDSPSDRIFGNKYYFNLREAVNECVEFLVDVNFLEQEMKKIGLLVVENANFITFYNVHSNEFAELRRKMLPMRLCTDEVKVTELYRIMVFKKTKSG
ncbi:mRNA cap methyltransferase [Trachipleistophora hominis]|uniref:mRNA cap guanine-N(7) methyltransferase n=1 Tax=Trachipleistophora hominis TaxID=72359 RepID=L7JT97_TRAHO|nr:mRNA cap methyltransferase [Trachipleistophora hominis]